MTKLPVKYVVVEGPDCAGKSSLCATLNRKAGFVKNIRDRSYLSTLCYARLYNREGVDNLRQLMHEEICNINNFFVILLPGKEVVLNRFHSRGDDFQDESSLQRLYDIFSEESERLSEIPNVLIVDREFGIEDLTRYVYNRICAYEQTNPEMLGSLLRMWTKFSPFEEVQLNLNLLLNSDYSDPTVMCVEGEAEYYEEIKEKIVETISNEIEGKNPYGSPQSLMSRRFYYASDTCISSIHFLNRLGDLKVICTLRSTDSIKNGSCDLRFLCHLSTEISKKFSWNPEKIDLKINYNSLHVRRDV